MYERFYGFSEEPFGFGPNPKFLYLTPSHADAISGMLSGVRERKGITVITGDPGTGKTTLIRAVLAELDEKVRTAFIVFTLLDFRDLLKSILTQLGLPAKGQDTSALLETFYLYLSERSPDEIVTIVIDEAQGLDSGVLKDLMKLWPGPNPQYSQLQIILVGESELEAKLDSQELRSLAEKIAVRRHIRPLTRQESNTYIDHRLAIAGRSSSEVFKPEAVDRIRDCARGNPRVISMLCDGSLLIGYAKYRRKIDTKIVNEAIQDLRLFKPKKVKRALPAEEPPLGEAASEPVATRRPWWQPAYQLLEWVRSLKPVRHPTAGPEEPVPVPELVLARRPRWQPVYPTLAGSLLAAVALGLFTLLTPDRTPREETTVKAVPTVIAEKDSRLSTLAKQNQAVVPVQSTSVKREQPRRIAHKKEEPPKSLADKHKEPQQEKPPSDLTYKQEERSQPLVQKQEEQPRRLAPYRPSAEELLLKEDAAWTVLQR